MTVLKSGGCGGRQRVKLERILVNPVWKNKDA